MVNPAKIVLFDIESVNLEANLGFMVGAAWKILGSDKIHQVKISDSPTFRLDCTNDKYVVERIANAIADADVWVTWYGLKFDVPFIQTRLIFHGLDVLPNVPHVDGWRIAKYKMRLHSNRLASISSFLGVDEKTPVKPAVWLRAGAGHRESIDYILEHCVQDVRVLEQVYERIKPLSTNHPNVTLVHKHRISPGGACPTCGSTRMHKRGVKICMTRARQQYQCQDCKAWSYGPAQKIDVKIHTDAAA